MSSVSSKPQPGRISAKWLIAAVLLIAAVIIGWRWIGKKSSANGTTADPRLTFQTRFRNVRPEVQFVGDAACVKCHPNHSANFHEHPMGRSVLPVSQATSLERYDESSHNPFTAVGFRYAVTRDGDRTWHSETRLRPDGRVLGESRNEVRYVLGSGSQGRVYLTEKDGYVWQSPIAWFRRTGEWNVAPGITPATNWHFERKVDSRCLFCHVDRADPVPDTLNRYSALSNPQSALRPIGCERCHGPGDLHVRFRENHGEAVSVDETIVNPRHLEPALREAVCQQCHLDAEVMVLRRGRQAFDFRPGLPLHLFWSMFVKPPGKREAKAVSQVEQMYASRCFQASKGRLGCISCHDPHELPASEERAAYYRRRCLECHAEGERETHKGKNESNQSDHPPPCSLPSVQRRTRSSEDSCIQCHMAQRKSTDISHGWLSDHRIPRVPSQDAEPVGRISIASHEAGLQLFGQELIEPAHQPELNRDLGIAIVEIGRKLNRQNRLEAQIAHELGNRALQLLEPGIATWPDDVDALEAKALALYLTGRLREALTVFDEVLVLAPQRELTLATAGNLAIELDQLNAARDYLQRAIAVNPMDASYHVDVARCFARQNEWALTAQACRRAVEISPFNLNARKFLVAAYLQLGDRIKANSEYSDLMALNPPDQDALRRWFTEQSKASGTGH